MKRSILFLILILASALLLAACNTDSGSDTPEPEDNGERRVILTADGGCEILTDTTVTVQRGGTARFDIKLADSAVLASLSAGKLVDANGNETDGVKEKNLTVVMDGVEESTVIKLFTEDLGYSTLEEYRMFHYVNGSDTVSVGNKDYFNAGTRITASAKRSDLKFIGWSIGSSTFFKSDCFSTERELDFRCSPDYVDQNGVLRLYANYVERNSLFYDYNGGMVSLDTAQVASPQYYTANTATGRLKLLYTGSYLDVFESPALFWDDGTFTRDGYVLVEYNTKPDGSGESYSLGSRKFLNTESDDIELLYCIWAKESDASDFTYVDYNFPLPEGTNAKKAPDWIENGIMITSYRGDDDVVVVPEKIDGKYVIAIGEGAFEARTMRQLVLTRRIQLVDKRAFTSCLSLETFYYPDSIYKIYNESFDEATTKSIRHLYVNATMAPRHTNTDAGAFAVKLSRLLAYDGTKRIIMIAGSSAYQGFGSEYAEALLGGEYRVINFGTTRTTNGIIYLEALSALAREGDIVLYAPENSTYMMGECELYWKTLRDMESLYNLYRYIDISEYTNVFGAMSDFNINYRYNRNPASYEDSYKIITEKGSVNRYGDYQNSKRTGLVSNYVDTYFLTFNKRFKSKNDGEWNSDSQIENKDYNDPANVTWQSIDTPYLVYQMNRSILSAQSSGAKVYFSFCPADADKLVAEARDIDWLLAYDKLISDLYCFDGVLGSCISYIYAHKYFYDCAFHLNDLGRTYRTYRVYCDLCELLGIERVGFTSCGTSFEGCLFNDDGSISQSGKPFTGVDYLS